MTPDGTPYLFGPFLTIEELIQTLGRVPPFEEALYWLKFTYTADRKEAYVLPASMVLDQYMVLEVDNLFYLAWRLPSEIYPGAYTAPTHTHHAMSISGTLGPEYLDYYPHIWAPERGDIYPGMEEGKGEGGC